jgi:hypothetical protein
LLALHLDELPAVVDGPPIGKDGEGIDRTGAEARASVETNPKVFGNRRRWPLTSGESENEGEGN